MYPPSSPALNRSGRYRGRVARASAGAGGGLDVSGLARSAARLPCVVVAMTMAIGSALAADSVSIRVRPAYPLPNRGSESIDLSVRRDFATTAGPGMDVDRYFDGVRKALVDAEVPPKWGWRFPDGAFVEIEINLDGKSFSISNAYDSGVVMLPQGSTEADKRVAAAVQRVLNLTVERARARLAK